MLFAGVVVTCLVFTLFFHAERLDMIHLCLFVCFPPGAEPDGG